MGEKNTRKNGGDDYAGIRDFQKGDSPRQLAWKASARAGKLQSKIFHETATDEIWLRWEDLPRNTDTEKCLSILCRWALNCDHEGLNYGLEIPGKTIQPSSGLQHKNNVLSSLALYKDGCE